MGGLGVDDWHTRLIFARAMAQDYLFGGKKP
jgi:hypothetical protein